VSLFENQVGFAKPGIEFGSFGGDQWPNFSLRVISKNCPVSTLPKINSIYFFAAKLNITIATFCGITFLCVGKQQTAEFVRVPKH